MRKLLLITILISTSITHAFAQTRDALFHKINEDAKALNLHPHQFLLATQTLAQNQYQSVDEKQPIPHDYFNLLLKNSDYWQGNLSTQAVSDEYISSKIEALPQAINYLNNRILKHANALQISLLDLNRFYSLRENSDYTELFIPVAFPEKQNIAPIASVIFTLPNTSPIESTTKQFKRSHPSHVAHLWHKAITAGLQDKQFFGVTYTYENADEVKTHELWRFYEGMGPRFMSAIQLEK